jgi:hypothetical protein
MPPDRPDSYLLHRDAEALRREAEGCLALASQTHHVSLAAELRAYAHELKSRARRMEEVRQKTSDG